MEYKSFICNTNKKYKVLVGDGLLSEVGALASETVGAGRALIVTDENVVKLYAAPLRESLLQAGYRVSSLSIPPGEASKAEENYFNILKLLTLKGFTRQDTIFALGGGVVGDLAGFAASTYMRGIHLVQLPTTLIAMADSSIGGKNGIDFCGNKNSLGTIYQPDLVITDPQLLETLPDAETASAMAEIVKYGFIDQSCGKLLAEKAGIRDLLSAAIQAKIRLVEADETDRGQRKLLNLGHSFGHCFEALSGYAIPHGQAVAMGLSLMSKISLAEGSFTAEADASLHGFLNKYNLPDYTFATALFSVESILEQLKRDKKSDGDGIDLIFPLDLGKSAIIHKSWYEVESLLRKVWK